MVPTLLDAYGLDLSNLEGRPLLQRRADLPVFSDTAGSHVVWQGPFKAVFDPPRGEQHLYNLEADPAERHDLSAEQPAELERLHQLVELHRQLGERLRQGRGRDTDLLTDEDRERLRALGYLGG